MARQKNVYKTHEIPHLWFHKTQQSARNSGGNLFFESDIIYSYGYHFQIARHITNSLGKPAVLFNSASDSSTTARHKSLVSIAIPGDVPVFRLAAGRRAKLTIENCAIYMNSAFSTSLNNLKQAKSRPSKAKAYSEFNHQSNNLVEFLQYLGQDNSHVLHSLSQSEHLEYIEILAEHTSKVSIARINREAKREAQYLAADAKMSDAERIEAWRDGKHASLPYNHAVMVRIKGDNVETSRGAAFPLAHAIKGLPLVMAIINGNMEYQRKESDPIIRLGNYAIDSIGSGVLKAGCHTITYDEIRHFAELVSQKQSTT